MDPEESEAAPAGLTPVEPGVPSDPFALRVLEMGQRLEEVRENDLYFYNIPITELQGGARVVVDGRTMEMFASYSYLGLIGHPRIAAAAHTSLDRFGTGTHGVRLLAGTLSLHQDLEAELAAWKGAQAAVTFSSGYVTNLTVISALLGRRDYVFSDKLNHASIVDGCLLSGAQLIRYRHNDPADLDERLADAPPDAGRLVVTDAVFSMDGDIVRLPELAEICRRRGAWLMVDEAHSLGVLGATGRGVEEHFGLPGVVDIQMGTLSKTVPSVGGFVAGRAELIDFLRHAARAYIFSAALPPPQAAAALEAVRVIREEGWRLEHLRRNTQLFTSGLRKLGFDTMNTQTPIVPILCRHDNRAFALARECHRLGLFVVPVVSPAVPPGMARLRATVTAAHSPQEIEAAVAAIGQAGQRAGLL
jgi:glycine C-acetyltransferase